MDVTTLAFAAAALVAKPFLKGIGEASSGVAVEIGQQAFNRVRSLFQDTGNQPGEQALERLAANPESPSRVAELARAIEASLSVDHRGSRDLTVIVESYERNVSQTVARQTASGDQNVQVAGTSGDVNVSYGGLPRGRPGQPLCPACGSSKVKNLRVFTGLQGQTHRCRECRHMW